MENKQYDKTNTIAIFRNDKGDNQKRPDYTGTVNVNGKEYKVSMWLKTSQKGTQFLAGQIQEPYNANQQQQQQAPQQHENTSRREK